MTRQTTKLGDAARAGWLYYIAGNTQDQIAAKLGVSRQSAQRLVALAMSEGLAKVRIEHPIARRLDLSEALTARFGLKFCDVAPSDPASSTTIGVAQSAARAMERTLSARDPIIMGVGAGRTLRAAVEQLPEINRPQHRVVSLSGNISPDGSAAYFNVVFIMADTVKAPSFPMPLPVIAASAQERDILHAQKTVRATLDMAAKAAITFVGISEFDDHAPLFQDGFITAAELAEMRGAAAVGEILGWAFDSDGRLIEGRVNDRVASAPIPPRNTSLVIAAAMGPRKQPGIAAAARGGLVNGLITNELTATALLAL
jgi:DNA-binding transcriptional regulator LsrR (DeoR family)